MYETCIRARPCSIQIEEQRLEYGGRGAPEGQDLSSKWRSELREICRIMQSRVRPGTVAILQHFTTQTFQHLLPPIYMSGLEPTQNPIKKISRWGHDNSQTQIVRYVVHVPASTGSSQIRKQVRIRGYIAAKSQAIQRMKWKLLRAKTFRITQRKHTDLETSSSGRFA